MTPDTLGKYEIRSTLGRGAMGVVYEGWDPVISRRVAIKTVRLPDASDAEAQEELARFKREAQAAGRLNHPNVVGVFDYSETADLAYIVMEFVEGQTLKGLIGEQERMALPVVARILKDVLDGLAYCHERGVVHRDIKPANIMITPEGQAKIADFGIARIESSSMTQAGTVLGTPAYMSPEQFMGVIVDARTDIYSTGVLLFQLLTGERPFEGSMTTIMHKVLNTIPPKPSELSVTAPRSLDDVVARAMARRPEDRFPTATAFLQALSAAMSNPQGTSAPAETEDGTVIVSTPRPPRPKPAPPSPVVAAKASGSGGSSRLPLFAGVAAAVVLAGGAGAYFLTRPDAPAENRQTAQSGQTGQIAPTGQAGGTPPAGASSGGGRTIVANDPVTPPKPSLPPMQEVKPVSPTEITPVRTPPPSGSIAPSVNPAAVTGQAQLVTPSATPLVQPTLTPVPPTTPTQTPLAQPPLSQTPPAQAVVTTPPTQMPPVVPPTIAAKPPEVVPPVNPPQQLAMLSPAQLRPALAAALASTACSYTVGAITPQGTASVQGIGSANAVVAMRQAAASAAPGVTIDWNLADIDPQFCPVLDLARGLAPEFGSPRGTTLSLKDAKTNLVTDDYILPRVTMPAYPAYLQVDYLVHDGTVVHLYPNKTDPTANDARRQFAAHAQARMGEPQGSFPGWQVYQPYGRDLIIAVASSVPLLGLRTVDPQSQSEPSGPYLAALRTAIEAARKREARVSVDALVLDTAEKP